jgi:hypothetical protein
MHDMRFTVSDVCLRSFRHSALSILPLSRRDRDEVGRDNNDLRARS